MSEPLTPLQLLVAKHYEGGEFAHVTTVQEAEYCGDTLFVFCLHEASDAEPHAATFHKFLQTAIDQLRSLQGNFD